MSVRCGESRDVLSIVGMACEFWEDTVYSENACPETITDMVNLCLDQQLLSVVEIDSEIVGFAAGIKGTLLGNRRASTGTELAWYVNPEHRSGTNGIKLLKHIESLAKAAGIKYWVMAYMESSMPETVKHIYEKMGYKQTEVLYMREL